MTIRSPEFAARAAALREAPSSADYDKACKNLAQFIDAHVTLRRRQAINAFKRACHAQGLTTVDKKGFDQLLKDIDRADRLPAGALASRARRILHEDVLALASPDDGTPEFTIREDEDLDRLLNSTATLLSGCANQDVGLAWYDDLQAVLARLSNAPGQWHDAAELPTDNTPVLAELKVTSRKKQRAFAVVSYFRTEAGVHEDVPGWFDEDGTERQVLRWQHINAHRSDE